MRLFLIIGLGILGFACRTNAQIVNIEEQRIYGTNDSIHWYGSLKAAFNFTKVKDAVYQWQVDSRVQYKNKRHLTLLLLNYSLLQAGNDDFVNSAFAHLRYNYKLTDPLVFEAYGQLQSNRLILIKSRTLLGSGLRYRFFLDSNKRSRLYLGASCMWENNDFLEGGGQQTWYRLGSYVSVSLRFKNNIAFVGTNYWQPVIGMIKNNRLLSDWTLLLPVTKRLIFSLDFTYTRETGLPDGAPPYTVTWRNGLTWKL